MQLELIWHVDYHCRMSVSWTMQSCNPHNFKKWSSRERNFQVSLSRYTSKYWCCQDYIKTELSFTQGKTRYIILYKNVICCHCFIVSYFTRYKSQKRFSCLDEFHLISRLCQFMRFKKMISYIHFLSTVCTLKVSQFDIVNFQSIVDIEIPLIENLDLYQRLVLDSSNWWLDNS